MAYTSIGGGFAAPRIRNVEHGGLVTISGRSPRLLLCIRHCVSATVSAVLYIRCCICHCVSTAVYPTLLSAAIYLTLVSATVYLPLYIYLLLYIVHCISATVSAVLLRVIEYKERLNYLSYKSDYVPNYLMVESMPLYA
jgi:hypothetical protein